MLANLATVGRADAPVAIIELSDFQCPFCATFVRTTFPGLKQEYVDTGRVVFAFMHLPLESIHPLAFPAATTAECARQQGRFWPLHDRLFANPLLLGPEALRDLAVEVGADQHKLDECLSKGEARDVVRASVDAAIGMQLGSTPTFLIGSNEPAGTVNVKQIIAGAAPIDAFRDAIDDLTGGDR
jgi:protein-disulfide isomerase